MGQATSNIGRNLQQSWSRAAAVMQRAARSSDWQQSHVDPHAQQGFARGQDSGPIRIQDEMQEQFLRSKQNVSSSQYREMPPDLVKFLQDVGPVRRVDPTKKELPRAPRLPRQLRGEPKEDKSADPPALPSGRIESMPLAANVKGYETLRSTNFSHRKDSDDPNDFGLDVVDLRRLLSWSQPNDPDLSRTLFYEEYIKKRPQAKWTEKERDEHLKLLGRTAHALELPIILQDTDGSYVGASASRIDELNVLNISIVPKTRVMLVIEDLSEKERIQEASLSRS